MPKPCDEIVLPNGTIGYYDKNLKPVAYDNIVLSLKYFQLRKDKKQLQEALKKVDPNNELLTGLEESDITYL